jgi:excisionase family DNA binding protein
MQQTLAMSLPGNKKLTLRRERFIIDGMEYVSVEEAAEMSGYSEQYVRRLVRRGKVAATKKGPMYWIEKDSLMAYKREMDVLGRDKFDPRRGNE